MIINQDVDAMWEEEAAAEWERLNAPDPYEKQMISAACSLDIAHDHLNKALDYISDALAELDETPMEKGIRELLDQLDDLNCSVVKIKGHYERGERE